MKWLVLLMVIVAACTLMNESQTVVVETSQGVIEVELDRAAPTTVNNFLQYVESGYYDGTVFHRVIPNFMIQGGGFTQSGAQKATNDPIPLEASLPNVRGTIAMARTNDPNSATSQFFINTVDNSFLNPSSNNPGYAVFGRVVSGMDVVDAISAVQTTTKHGMQDWPVEDVVIERVYVK